MLNISVYRGRRSFNNRRHERTAVCSSCAEAVRNAREIREGRNDGKELIDTLESSDRLRIIKDGADVYVGYLAEFRPFADHKICEEYRKYSEDMVKKFRAVPEITHKRWQELGLIKPLEPDQTAQYKFSDLQMSLYYTIYI